MSCACHAHGAIDYGEAVLRRGVALETSLAAVRLAGGTIVKEPFSLPGGRRFEFTDPSRNALAVWSDA